MNVFFILHNLLIVHFAHALNKTSSIQAKLDELSEKCSRVVSLTSTFEYTFMATLAVHKPRRMGISSPEERRGLLIERATAIKHVFCRGAIIHPDWVISAARCFDDHTNIQRLRVHAGVVGMSQGEDLQIRFVERVVIHPKYNITNDENNIAMIKVGVSFVITAFVHPGYLPNAPFGHSGADYCSIMRATPIRSRGKYFEKLFTIQLQAVVYDECVDLYEGLLLPHPRFNLTTQNFCMFESKMEEFKGGVCKTDVGGPAVCMYQIQGIVSHYSRHTCFKKGYPTTVTDVGQHLDWIRATIIQLNIVRRDTGSSLSTNRMFSILMVLVVLIQNRNA